MKFATALLLTTVSATEVSIPTIEWDQTQFDTAATDYTNGTDTYNTASSSNDVTWA